MENGRFDPADPEAFARVWDRVMPDPGEDCPIEVLRKKQKEDAPEPGRCFGPESRDMAGPLRELIREERADAAVYAALARRGGSTARTLEKLSRDERRHARQLSAAYFLITGESYTPPAPQGSARIAEMPMREALRDRFQGEQQGESAYLRGAEKTGDPCLRELFLDLAGDERGHARTILRLLEK